MACLSAWWSHKTPNTSSPDRMRGRRQLHREEEKKMKVRTVFTVSTILGVILWSCNVFADWTPQAKVVYVHATPSGFNFALAAVNPCPTVRTDGQLGVVWTSSNADQLYTLILMAYRNGDLVAANYNCAIGGLTSDIDVRKP